MVLSDSDPDLRVDELRESYRGPLKTPRLLIVIALVVLIFVAGLLLARVGSDLARFFSGAAICLLIGAMAVLLKRDRAKWAETSRALLRSLSAVDEESAQRANRAYLLWKRTESADGQESPELALHHLKQTMKAVPMEAVVEAAQKKRSHLHLAILLLLLLCSALFYFRSLAIIEGAAVLSARNGVGSFPIAYVEQMSMTAQLPRYLDGAGKKRFLGARLNAVPVGSEVEVRIIPRVQDRRLFLTDGLKEVPFVSDGQGAFIAHWTAEEESDLRVGARFGLVFVHDALKARVSPTSDRSPLVFLEGAGQEFSLADFSSLPLSYRAVDDHGISKIVLVLKSGQRTERTELVHLGGQKRGYRGAHTLTRDHPLIHQAFLPVKVSIEARDENILPGLGWGKSAVITLMPEPLGNEQAQRHVALRSFRRAVSAYLAKDIQAARLSTKEAKEARLQAGEQLSLALGELKERLLEAGTVPERSLLFIEAQLEAMERAGVERASPESVLLAVDALIQSISHREATELAKELGAAVEEVAVQIRHIRFDPEAVDREGLSDLLDAASKGAARLREVGRLGLDLGSVARGDLARVKRSLEKSSYDRAEGAAFHLAERLKRATPSFSSSGGAGVESGSPSGASGQGAPQKGGEGASDAPSQFDDLSSQIDQLAHETATELSQLEKLLKEARKAAEADFEAPAALDEAREEFEQALRGLPRSSQRGRGAAAEAASARSQGEAMLDALESGDLSEAVERGLDAKSALSRANKLQSRGLSWLDSDALDEAQESLSRLLMESQKALNAMERKRKEGVGESLSERSEKQRDFAQRAGELAESGKSSHAPLGQEEIDSLKQAAKLLRQAATEMDAGRAEAGAEFAQEAQSQLESVLPQGESSSEDAGGGSSKGKHNSKGSVPEEEKDRARDFRRRVEEGLGRKGGGLAPAIRRYAEELK